jgi:hypothetical protein
MVNERRLIGRRAQQRELAHHQVRVVFGPRNRPRTDPNQLANGGIEAADRVVRRMGTPGGQKRAICFTICQTFADSIPQLLTKCIPFRFVLLVWNFTDLIKLLLQVVAEKLETNSLGPVAKWAIRRINDEATSVGPVIQFNPLNGLVWVSSSN